MKIIFIMYITDAEGVHVSVDVGECVDICSSWISGFGGLQVHPHNIHHLSIC